MVIIIIIIAMIAAGARGSLSVFYFFQAEDGIRDLIVTVVQTCALPIWSRGARPLEPASVARDSAGSRAPPAPGRTGVKRRTTPSAPSGALAKPLSAASSGENGGS